MTKKELELLIEDVSKFIRRREAKLQREKHRKKVARRMGIDESYQPHRRTIRPRGQCELCSCWDLNHSHVFTEGVRLCRLCEKELLEYGIWAEYLDRLIRVKIGQGHLATIQQDFLEIRANHQVK